MCTGAKVKRVPSPFLGPLMPSSAALSDGWRLRDTSSFSLKRIAATDALSQVQHATGHSGLRLSHVARRMHYVARYRISITKHSSPPNYLPSSECTGLRRVISTVGQPWSTNKRQGGGSSGWAASPAPGRESSTVGDRGQTKR